MANLITVMGYLITVMGHSMANPITVMENLIGVMADEGASGQPQRTFFGPRVPRLGHPCHRRGPRGQKDFQSGPGPDLSADGIVWVAVKPGRSHLVRICTKPDGLAKLRDRRHAHANTQKDKKTVSML